MTNKNATIDWCSKNLADIQLNYNSLTAQLPYDDNFMDMEKLNQKKENSNIKFETRNYSRWTTWENAYSGSQQVGHNYLCF
jgi:hypothetical protein